MHGKQFEELLKKYLEGRATAEERDLVDDWYKALSTKEEVRVEEDERKALRSSYWSAVQSRLHIQTPKQRMLLPRILAVAASLAFIAVLIIYSLPRKAGQEIARMTAPEHSHAVENPTDEIMLVTLPDSSVITLFPNSAVRYGQEFNVTERKVALIGQAFFEITHDAKRPFLVFANEVVAKVLGTSFNVIAYPADDSVMVRVKTGRVSVFTKRKEGDDRSELDEIILTPNQQAVYTRKNRKVARVVVDRPNVMIRHEEVLRVRFEAAPISKVFETLEKMYKVRIEFDKNAFSTCSITTSASGKDMFERIDVICEIIGATYSVQGDTILISGAGCD